MLAHDLMILEVKRAYPNLASYLIALKDGRNPAPSYEELAKLGGTSASVIFRACKGDALPEPAADRLIRHFRLTGDDAKLFRELNGWARVMSNKLTRVWAEKLESRLVTVERRALYLARFVLKFREQLPKEVIDRCEATIKFLESPEDVDTGIDLDS